MKERKMGGGLGLADNAQASAARKVSTNSENYDMGRVRKYSEGTKGYPSQASQASKKKQ